MKRQILLDPGIIPFSPLRECINTFLANNKLIIINDNPRKNDWGELESKCELISYYQLHTIESINKNPNLKNDYTSLLQGIINDHRTLLIYERVTKIFGWNSLFNGIQKIEILIYNSLDLLQRIKPDILFFQATPHNLSSWILAKTAEFLQIKVHMIQTSPLPWRFWVVEGLDKQIPIFSNEKIEINEADKNIFQQFWEMNNANYDIALPSYEKKRIQTRGGKYWSWKKELKDGIKQPKKLLTLLYKYKLYCAYKSLTTVPNYSQKYIIFFLHYQPERTSMPEGGFYSQQWLIIRHLSLVLPKDWVLYIKEHPSTFTGKYDIKYRNPNFYRTISNLSNVKLLPIETDTFNLIDSSQFVVTITGTVGIQSLIRKKPVIVFGYSSYRDFQNGVYKINNIQDLVTLFQNKHEDVNFDVEQVYDYLLTKNHQSISGYDQNKCDDIYDKFTRINGHINLLLKYFSI
ncbi:hypothetical protein [Proteiniphilum sp. UBA5384]|uniref:capsular polysaccharide export protein, LipB/KpsS family n=1 Tax=Proteiniphilum sp. UBA5384 TaxID=1947279 RepID=UPI0025F5FC44|nr:hypothetical protein [Proteiniphilum sp. UBA5384]